MTRYLLLRHAETEWNREKVFRGRKDIPLSEKGRDQINRVAATLANVLITAVYSSPLSRAHETAGAIAGRHGLEVQTREDLLDMKFGEWEGKPISEVEEKFPEKFAQWRDHPEEFVPPSGEGLAQIRARIVKFLREVNALYPDKTVVVVTHRVLCKLAVCEVLGLNNSAFWKIQQDVCALNVFTRENDKYVLLKMNETCHLGPAEEQMDF